jgi:hypothetical protein
MAYRPPPSSRRKLIRRLAILATVGGVGIASFQSDRSVSKPDGASSDRMADELLSAAGRADMCTAVNAVGVGLKGEYFAEADLAGSTRLVRIDDVIDFDASVGNASGNEREPVRSVRWSGWLKAPISGSYRFHADAPGMRVSVARTVVAETGVASGEKIDLAAGRFYPVEVEVRELVASAPRIRLEWTAPHGARYVVPKALLHLPTDSVPAGSPAAPLQSAAKRAI